MRALVTGAAGFVGGHLSRYLYEQDHSVAGLVLPQESDRGLGSLPGVAEIFQGDILDGESVKRVLANWKPAAIYHLAAFSNPQSSWMEARLTLETNILGTHNLLQAAVESGLKPRVLLVGSSQQYGLVPEEHQPIGEEQSQRPLTPYGVSKASQEILGQRFHLSGLIPVLLTRSFNHTGPGQTPGYVCSSLARQIAEIESGAREARILVGNLSARRDFSDVRDVVSAYRRIMECGEPGEPYNVCRGEAFSIRQIVDKLLELTPAHVAIEVVPDRYHAFDAPLLLGNNSKLRQELGWEPRYSLKQTLSDLLDYWREVLN